jgi:hypothetical protein
MNSLSPSSLPALPKASAWPLVRALFKQPARPSAQPIQASYRLDRLDADHVRRYSDAFCFPPGPVPLTYLYLLAQRAQLATMLDRAIPFRIVGLIHVANSLTMHSAVRLEAALTLVTTRRTVGVHMYQPLSDQTRTTNQAHGTVADRRADGQSRRTMGRASRCGATLCGAVG